MKVKGERRKAKDKSERRARWYFPRLPMALALLCFILHPSSFILALPWQRQASGTMAWLHGVYFLNERRGWAVGSKGALLHTEDGGQSWRTAPRPTPDTLRDVYFADERRGWLVCERSIYELYTKTDARSYLLRTEDGGQTWARVEAAGADVDVLLLRVVFADEQHGWAFGEGGALYVTRDGGANWSRQRVPTPHVLLGAVFLDGARGWLSGANATMLFTADSGEQWRTLSLPVELARARLNAVEFVNGWRGWAVGNAGLILSTADGGRTWHQAQGVETEANLNDVKFLNEQEGWAVGAGGTILHTIDGGAKWEVETSSTRHPLERLALAGPTRAWAVGFGGTIVAQTTATAPPPRLSEPPVTRKRRVAN